MFVCCECCVLSGRGPRDGLITRPEESYRLWRVVVCDQETSKTRRLKPATGLWTEQSQWVVTSGKQTKKPSCFGTLMDVMFNYEYGKECRQEAYAVFSIIARFPSSARCSCGLRSSWVLQGLGL
jgi:hypothetical protein